MKSPVDIYVKFTVGASGSPTLVTASSPGVASVARTAAGDYKITLSDRYNALLAHSVSLVSSTLQSLGNQVKAESMSSKTVDLYFYNSSVPGGRTVYTGITEVQTWTAQALASCVDGDYLYWTDNEGNGWAVALDTTGGAATTPTGAKWTSVAAANKVYADVSGATTAAEVMALVEAAINGLTGFTAKFSTNDTAANGTMIVTWLDQRAQVPTADPQQDDDAGAGTSLTAASTTDGRDGAVSIANDTITIPAHGIPTAAPVKIYGSNGVPTGITEGTTYYAIADSADTIKLATSATNAVAGTAINLTADAPADGFLEVAPQAAAIDPASGSTVLVKLELLNHAD